jgi:hypothetical protein
MRDELYDLVEAAENLSLPVVPEALAALDELHWGTAWERAFAALAALQAAVRELERSAARMAQIDGKSWQKIGGYLGLTAQGARKRHGLNHLDELDALDELHDAEMQALCRQVRLKAIRARSSSDRTADDSSVSVPQDDWQEVMEHIQRHARARRELIKQLQSD